MRHTRCGATAAVTEAGNLCICGGMEAEQIAQEGQESFAVQLHSVECYRPSIGTWELMEPMLSPHSFSGAVNLGSHLYVFGGQAAHGLTSVSERMDLQHGTWQALPPMPDVRINACFVAAHASEVS